MRALERYQWPGNVRELRNVVERAVILGRGDIIDVTQLPQDLFGRVAAPPTSPSALSLEPGMRVEHAERRLIEITLERTGRNKTKAADMLGISVRTLHNKLQKFRAADGSTAAVAERS